MIYDLRSIHNYMPAKGWMDVAWKFEKEANLTRLKIIVDEFDAPSSLHFRGFQKEL